jgi:dynein light chain LC8-type
MNKDVALQIKKDFDNTFHGTWQCVVGKDFGSEVGFEQENMIYFYWGETAILLWKAG